MTFTVIDRTTRVEADKVEVARERWARGRGVKALGFVLLDDGTLFLAFESGRLVECPKGRFRIVVEGDD
jgi:hypothetical protein